MNKKFQPVIDDNDVTFKHVSLYFSLNIKYIVKRDKDLYKFVLLLYMFVSLCF